MNDEFYNDFDEGRDIEHLSEEEENEIRQIEGIESDEEYASEENSSGAANTLTDQFQISTPENPLYDPTTGERIPYGYSLKDWEKRKRAVQKRQAGIKAMMERDRQFHEAEEERLKQLEREEEYDQRQKERALEAHEEIADDLAGQGEGNIARDESLEKAGDGDLSGIVKEIDPFEERQEEDKTYGRFPSTSGESIYHGKKLLDAQPQMHTSKDEEQGADNSGRYEPIKSGEERACEDIREDDSRGIFALGPDFEKDQLKDVRGQVNDSAIGSDGALDDRHKGNKKHEAEPADEVINRKRFEQLDRFDSSKAYQMPNGFNDGSADTTYHAGANAKSQLNDTVASRADSVVMAFATALEGDTRGTYGIESIDSANYGTFSGGAVNVKKNDDHLSERIYKDMYIENKMHIDNNMYIENEIHIDNDMYIENKTAKTALPDTNSKEAVLRGKDVHQILSSSTKDEQTAIRRQYSHSSGKTESEDKTRAIKEREVISLQVSEKIKPDDAMQKEERKDGRKLSEKAALPYEHGRALSEMLDRTSAIDDAAGSEIGKTGRVFNHSKQDQLITVKSTLDARRNENLNYKTASSLSESIRKNAKVTGYADEDKKKFLKDIEEALSLGKDSAFIPFSSGKKEDPNCIESVYPGRRTKAGGRSFDNARDGIEALGVTAANNIKTADDSDENDVKKGLNMVKSRLDDVQILLGTSGLFAASKLDASMGARQAFLMEKLSQTDTDPDKLSVFSDRKERLKHCRKSLTSEGAKRSDANKAYRDAKDALIKDLQKQGLNRYEARDLLKRGLGGESVFDNLMTAMAARNELLDKASKDRGLFTDEELSFIRSKEFFNTGRSSRQISALTKKYFDKSGNEYLKKLNPGASYLSAVAAREGTGKLSPNVMGRHGFSGKVDAIINPHSYNLNINLTREKLHNRNHIRLERIIKKDPDSFSLGQMAVLKLQKDAEKHSSYIERRKIFNKNKYSIKNVMRVSLHYFEKLESDTTAGLNQILSVKHGADAAYSLLKLGLKSTWIAAAPIRFIARKTGVTSKIRDAAGKVSGDISAVIHAKKTVVAKKVSETKVVRGISRTKETISTSKPVVGVSSRLGSAKKLKQKTGRKIRGRKNRMRNSIMNNPAGRIIAAPFRTVAVVSKTINRIKEIFLAIGHWILLAVGVTVVIWFVLLYMAGLLMSFGKSIDITGRYVIMADQELIEGWIKRYLLKDDEKYDEAVSHAEDDPIDPHAWGGVKLYHYGVYEPASSTYFNRNYTSCYYHEKGKTKKNKAKNGFHIIYIDRDGNTIGSNTTNIKDVLSVSTVMTGNDWYSHQKDAEGLMDELYTILNPEAAYVESEIYACTNGCDTYPRKHDDGDPENPSNWYSGSNSAYECSDDRIYTEYERLLGEGVRFYPDDTYTYSSREFYERLVPQTDSGCNPAAKFSFERVKVSEGHYERYTTSEDGREHADYSSWVPSEYRYQLKDIEYINKCGGRTYCYVPDPGGYLYKNSDTEPYTYAPLYSDDPERIQLVNEAGFYGSYSRDYSSTIPHTAIKCCYGHKNLNIYITVLTKEDLIEANGGSIEYRVPLHFSHETGEVTQWETKRTESIFSYTRSDNSLRELTKAFYESGGFQDAENTRIIDQIYGEDWYELYGVNVYSGAALPDTLSRKSSVSRLNHTILGDVSELRKSLVETAYGQVGRIPYYWGGKATSKDIHANRFGSPVTPDYKGRRKKGLDCGGFVQLMFCIASGAELNEVGSSTRTFVPSLGLERVSYKDLLPGDIGMENIPGAETNHIGIYAGDGMWIHCQGAPSNTVVYNNSNCFRYYYSLGR